MFSRSNISITGVVSRNSNRPCSVNYSKDHVTTCFSHNVEHSAVKNLAQIYSLLTRPCLFSNIPTPELKEAVVETISPCKHSTKTSISFQITNSFALFHVFKTLRCQGVYHRIKNLIYVLIKIDLNRSQ